MMWKIQLNRQPATSGTKKFQLLSWTPSVLQHTLRYAMAASSGIFPDVLSSLYSPIKIHVWIYKSHALDKALLNNVNQHALFEMLHRVFKFFEDTSYAKIIWLQW